MKKGEGAFNLFSSVAVESLEFLLIWVRTISTFENVFYVATLFDLFMKNAEGAFNLFSSVAVESLQFLLPLLLRHFMR